jgi:hypothetical protein
MHVKFWISSKFLNEHFKVLCAQKSLCDFMVEMLAPLPWGFELELGQVQMTFMYIHICIYVHVNINIHIHTFLKMQITHG